MSRTEVECAKREVGSVFIRYLRHWSSVAPIVLTLAAIVFGKSLVHDDQWLVSLLVLWAVTALLLVASMAVLKGALRERRASIKRIHAHVLDKKLLGNLAGNHFRKVSVVSYVLTASVPAAMVASHANGAASGTLGLVASAVFHWFVFHALLFFAAYMGQFHEVAREGK